MRSFANDFITENKKRNPYKLNKMPDSDRVFFFLLGIYYMIVIDLSILSKKIQRSLQK